VQIENYKNALIKMRDIVTTANYERAEMQQQYEQCRAEYLHVQAENDKLAAEFSQVCDEVMYTFPVYKECLARRCNGKH
jgi:hypothetical protein